MSLQEIQKELQKASNKEKAKDFARFFKTGKGEYGEGDIFIGITVPVQRKIAHSFPTLSLEDIKSLLQNNIHEYRFTALENVTFQYEQGDEKKKREIFNFYLQQTARINNWDLVDTSASYVVGNFLLNKERKVLYKLAKSKSLWERRIAIVATYYFIQKGDLQDTFTISEMLLSDTHDLIHKAVGWMLRESGKKDETLFKAFLKKHYKNMPRTALRYAIEKFPELERKKYLKGLI